MRRFDPKMVLLVAITVASCSMSAQTPTPKSSEVPQTITSPDALQPTQEQIADSLMAHQRYQAAVEAYKKVRPETAVAWNKMGIAYQMLFNLQDAQRAYERSLRMDPKNSNVWNNLGTVYDAQKDYGSAERLYRKALRIDPKSALILKNLGTDLLAQHKYKKGWAVYQEALAIDPEVFDTTTRPRVENPATIGERGAMNYYMAKGCVRAGMPDRAIEYLRMALNEGFTNPKKINEDNEFASLHGLPAFEQLMAEQKAQ